MKQPFYRFITAEAVDEPASAELLIFDVIGNFAELGEVSAKQFAGDLAKLPTSVKRLDIHINSPGGSLSEAQGIYSRLADHRSDKFVFIDGMAASAASIIAMVGKKVFIRSNANMMIHNPSGITIGDAEEHRKMIAALESLTETMINTYQRKTKLDRDIIRNFLAKETWFTPEQAVENGFADEIRGVVKAAALGDKRVMINGLTFDLSQFNYQNVPAFTAETPTERTTMSKPTNTAPAAEPPKEEKPKNNDNGEENKETLTPDTSPKPQPPPQTQLAAEFNKGVTAERERIAALQKLDKPATHDIIAKAITDGKTTADIAAECIEAMANAGTQQSRRADAKSLDNIPPSGEQTRDGEGNDFGAVLTKAVSARLKARGHRSALHSRN